MTGGEARQPERSRVWWFRRVATRYLNPFTRQFAGWAPGFGIVTHRGRRTGREYRTPLNLFRRGDAYVFFLTYGSDVDWVKNVLAAGRCTLRTLGRDVDLVEPELIEDPARTLVPGAIRAVGQVLGATGFLVMRAA